MSKTIISEIPTVDDFFNLLKHNPGLIIIKFGANWCGPCKTINPYINNFFATSPQDVVCAEIDIDQSPNVYSYLKSKKMVYGIPVILCYKKGNQSFIPDNSVTGADLKQLDIFFKTCSSDLLDVKQKFPPGSTAL